MITSRLKTSWHWKMPLVVTPNTYKYKKDWETLKSPNRAKKFCRTDFGLQRSNTWNSLPRWRVTFNLSLFWHIHSVSHMCRNIYCISWIGTNIRNDVGVQSNVGEHLWQMIWPHKCACWKSSRGSRFMAECNMICKISDDWLWGLFTQEVT